MLDMQELALLTDQERSEYMDWERGFESDFWMKVKEMAQHGSEEALLRAARAETWENNRINFGQNAVWELIANLDDQIGRQYQQLALTRATQATFTEELDYE